jgi:hypothetical protein
MMLASLAGRNRANGTLPAGKARAILDDAMTAEVNQGVVGDTAKLIMHRLIARQIRRDPALVDNAKIAHARQADQFAGWPFVREWDELLSLPPDKLTSKLISRDREMVRLRNSSPFYLLRGGRVRGIQDADPHQSCGEKDRGTRLGGPSDAADPDVGQEAAADG